MGFWQNLITFGASGRIEDQIRNYENLTRDFQDLLTHFESRREETKVVLEMLIEKKVEALNSLKKITKISKNLSAKDRELVEKEINQDELQFEFKNIEVTIEAGNIAINSAKGVGAGLSTALGAWAIAGTIGTASTGTAISSLSGIAAYNATLAYIGGGALAAGGGGMAAGTAILGGLVVIPALVLAGVFNHISANKKINEIVEREVEVIKAIGECQKGLLSFDLIEKRSNELIHGLNKEKQVFDIEFQKVYKTIYPYFFSKPWKTIRKFFTGKYFNNKDLVEISYIGQVGSNLANIIDQKLIDQNGKPI